MRHGSADEGHNTQIRKINQSVKELPQGDFVLEKSIFNNIFEKDIRRVYIYKKAERLGKAIHLITPAFIESMSLRNRIDAIAIGLVDAALMAPHAARIALSRELLALSSILSIARTGGFLSAMNTDLITREAHLLLQEIAAYEEPRLYLDEAPTLSGIARSALSTHNQLGQTAEPGADKKPQKQSTINTQAAVGSEPTPSSKGHIKDIQNSRIKDRREAILSVIKNKGQARIKDISTFIRGISEKTIQRELTALISEGVVAKKGERRWSTYSLV